MKSYKSSSEYRHLLGEIVARPEDDLPKKVLADWLEENGGADEAEFIRFGDPSSCGFMLSKGGFVGPSIKAWRSRARQMLTGLIPKSWQVEVISLLFSWTGTGKAVYRVKRLSDMQSQDIEQTIPSWNHAAHSMWAHPATVHVGFRCGFIVGVASTAKRLVKVLPRLLSSHPVHRVGVAGDYYEPVHFVTRTPDGLPHMDNPHYAIGLQYNRVPKEVWPHLGGEPSTFIGDPAMTYPSMAELLADYERAILAAARSPAPGEIEDAE